MVIWFIRNGLWVTYATKNLGKHQKLITVKLHSCYYVFFISKPARNKNENHNFYQFYLFENDSKKD